MLDMLKSVRPCAERSLNLPFLHSTTSTLLSIQQAQWGNEDFHIFFAVERAKFRRVEMAVPELLHVFHTHAKAWQSSLDVREPFETLLCWTPVRLSTPRAHLSFPGLIADLASSPRRSRPLRLRGDGLPLP